MELVVEMTSRASSSFVSTGRWALNGFLSSPSFPLSASCFCRGFRRGRCSLRRTLAVAGLRPYGRRAAVLGLSSTPFLLQVPVIHAFELPTAERDEFDEEEAGLVHLFEQATRSVVSIQNVEVLRSKVEAEKVEGVGSGFIWDKFGHIVTNYHVVAKFAMDSSGRQKAQGSLLGIDGRVTVHEARLIGLDSTRDLAVLKIDAPADRLAPIPVGTSEDLRVGQNCYAIGNPYGLITPSQRGEIPSPAGKPIPGAIQTDAAINAGNSGGPLLDSFGRIVGVNTATFTRAGSGMSSGVNFAIPIDMVRRLVPRLIVNGTASPSNSAERSRLGLPVLAPTSRGLAEKPSG